MRAVDGGLGHATKAIDIETHVAALERMLRQSIAEHEVERHRGTPRRLAHGGSGPNELPPIL